MMTNTFEFAHHAKLNKGEVVVYLEVDEFLAEDGTDWLTCLDAVYYECTDITCLLSQDQLDELESEAKAAFRDH
jgi:hypothetical protein